MNSDGAPDTSAKSTPPAFLLLAVIAFGFFASIALCEITLRIIGFSFRLYPEKIELEGFKSMASNYVPDPDVFWVTADYHQKIEDLVQSKPDVLFMGDSCTQFGTYPKFLAAAATTDFPGKKFSGANIGIAGWDSYQGLKQMERDVLRIKPKIITLYYGWNDHWNCTGIEDKFLARYHTTFWSIAARSRIVQLVMKGYLQMKGASTEACQRVSVKDFGNNLTEIVHLAKENGITPVILTAPTSMRAGNVPAYLLGTYVKDLAETPAMHQRYVDVARAVAAAEHAPLCDLAENFSGISARTNEMINFTGSGIHLNKPGNEKIAEFLKGCLVRDGLWQSTVE